MWTDEFPSQPYESLAEDQLRWCFEKITLNYSPYTFLFNSNLNCASSSFFSEKGPGSVDETNLSYPPLVTLFLFMDVIQR